MEAAPSPLQLWLLLLLLFSSCLLSLSLTL
jgi:hypothetical protein